MKIRIPEKIKIAIEELARREIRRNFEVGGRYGSGKFGGGKKKWKKSLRAKLQNGQTLIDTERLVKSVGAILEENDLVLHASNVEYAGYLHYGTEKMVARPFLTLPDNFEERVVEIIDKKKDEIINEVRSKIIELMK